MEYLDIYDNNNNLTGRKIIRGDKTAVLSESEHIALAVIFIENNQGEYLMEKTSIQKGNEFSSIGGHVDSGETPLTTIKREVLEELGIDISNNDITYLGYLMYDMPIRHLFYLKKEIDISKVTAQPEEVAYVKYMTIDDIKKLIKNNQITKSHGILFNRLLELKDKKSINK